jgi:hypothetical protein
MHRLRFAILGAAAALALGTATAVAMQSSAGGSTDPDQHGDNVASAARTTCPHGPGGVHGQCVSAVASSKSEGTEDTATRPAAPASTCKAQDKTEDTSEKKPAKGDKAAKGADKTEDKTEHQAFAACVKGHATQTLAAPDAETAADASEKSDK